MSQQFSHTKLPQSIAKQYLSPVFVSMLICYALSVLLGIISALEENPINILLDYLHQIPFVDQSIVLPLEAITNSIGGVQIVLLLCGAVTVAGFCIILWGAKNSSEASAYHVGFTAIEIVKFNQLLLSLFVMPWLAIHSYKLLNSVKTFINGFGVQDIASQIGLLQAFVVIVALGTIVYLFDILLTFMLFKDSACNGSVNSRRSFYAPAYCFGLSAIIVYIQLEFGFSFPVLLYCASMTLFGVFLVQYNKEMQRHK